MSRQKMKFKTNFQRTESEVDNRTRCIYLLIFCKSHPSDPWTRPLSLFFLNKILKYPIDKNMREKMEIHCGNRNQKKLIRSFMQGRCMTPPLTPLFTTTCIIEASTKRIVKKKNEQKGKFELKLNQVVIFPSEEEPSNVVGGERGGSILKIR